MFFETCVLAERPYQPSLVETLEESWRWREFPEVKGRGLNCFDQGPDGSIWFGVNEGALRYDGLEWTDYRGPQGLPDAVRSFAVSGKDFFAATRSSIFAFENERWVEIFPGKTQRNWIIEDLHAARDGSLWAATDWGALRIEDPQLALSEQKRILFAAQPVAAYFEADQQQQLSTVVVGTPDSDKWGPGCGAYVYGPVPYGNAVIALAENGPAAKAGLSIGDRIVGINGEERLTVYQTEIEPTPGTQVNLVVQRPGESELLNLQVTAVGDVAGVRDTFRPYRVVQGHDGSLWFATRLGSIISMTIAEDGQQTWTHHSNQYELPDVAVPSITATADGLAAVGRSTNTRVLLEYNGQKWRVRTLKREIGSSITQLADGKLLVGSDGAVILIDSRTHAVRSTTPYGTNGNDILVKQTLDGAIWIAAKGGNALRVEPQGKNWTTYEGIIYQATGEDDSEWFLSHRLSVIQRQGDRWREFDSEDGLMATPTAILATKSGDVWVSGSHHGVAATARWTAGKWTLMEHPRLSWTIDRRSVFEDRDGRVWFGAASLSAAAPEMVGGVLRYDGHRWKHIEPTNRLTYSYQITQTPDGSLWFAGPLLVQILPDDQFGDLASVPAKAHGYCECTASDLFGNLWAGTRNHGLMKLGLGPDGVTALADWFDESDGISSNRIRSILPLSDGTVLAHTSEGFHRYDGRSWNTPALPEVMAPLVDASGIRQSVDGSVWLNMSEIGSIVPMHVKSNTVKFETPDLFRTARYVPDSNPPETKLTSRVTELIVGDDGIFTWTGTDRWNRTPASQLTYSWRIDQGEWGPFVPAKLATISNLAAGAHELHVRARDQDFNVESTPASVRFEVFPVLINRGWFRGLILSTFGLLCLALVQTSRIVRREATLRTRNAELIAAENQLQMANLVLEDRVVERTTELKHANERLRLEVDERIAAECKLRESELRYRSLVDMLPNGVQCSDLDGRITFANAMYAQMYGCPSEELLGRYIWDFETTEEKRQALEKYYKTIIREQPEPTPFETTNRLPDGRLVDIEVIWSYDRDTDGRLVGFVSIISDVSQRKQAEDLIRAENELLAAVAQGEPFSATMNRLTTFVESQSPGLTASIMLVTSDKQHLRLAAGSLPADLRKACDGLPIGEGVGSCGTAAFRGRPVFVDDIASDPLWHGNASKVTKHGLAACWSTPILDSDGSLQGTFAVYAHKPGPPTSHQLRLIEIVTHLAAVTIGRERSQKALKESERRFRTIFEQAAVGVAQLDPKSGAILNANRRYCEITGYSAEQLVGRTWMELSHPQDMQLDDEKMAQVLGGEIREFAIEKRIERKGGDIIWVNKHVSTMWQAGEEPSELIVILQDITERKNDELRTQQLFNRNQALVSALGEIVYDWQPDTDQLSWEGNFLEMLGYSCQQIGEKSAAWLAHVHVDDAKLVSSTRAAAYRQFQQYDLEYRVQRADGTYCWVHDRGVHVAAESSRIIGVMRDISRRKQADAERENRHQTLVRLDENVRNLFSMVRSGKPFFTAICQDIGKMLRVDLCAVPIVNESGTDFTYQAAAGPRAQMLKGKTMPISGGGLCGWVIANHEPLCIADLTEDERVQIELAQALDVTTAILAPLAIEGQVAGGLSVFRKGEAFSDFELRTLNLYAQSVAAAYENWLTLSGLENRVAERTRELAETNAELESFARTVSHDLRAPLRAMEGFAAALAEDYGHQIDEEGQEFIQHIIDSAKRLDGMVADLLAYSRLGRTELRVTSIALNDIVSEALNRLSSETASRNAKLHVESGMPSITGHKSTLVQVVTNLISNAVKFVPQEIQPEVKVWAESQPDGYVRLTVQDNGIGIDPAYQQRIFQVFERLHGIESYPGTGIGLAIVARACERLGGSYGMESQPGSGSRFWVAFPNRNL